MKSIAHFSIYAILKPRPHNTFASALPTILQKHGHSPANWHHILLVDKLPNHQLPSYKAILSQVARTTIPFSAAVGKPSANPTRRRSSWTDLQMEVRGVRPKLENIYNKIIKGSREFLGPSERVPNSLRTALLKPLTYVTKEQSLHRHLAKLLREDLHRQLKTDGACIVQFEGLSICTMVEHEPELQTFLPFYFSGGEQNCRQLGDGRQPEHDLSEEGIKPHEAFKKPSSVKSLAMTVQQMMQNKQSLREARLYDQKIRRAGKVAEVKENPTDMKGG